MYFSYSELTYCSIIYLIPWHAHYSACSALTTFPLFIQDLVFNPPHPPIQPSSLGHSSLTMGYSSRDSGLFKSDHGLLLTSAHLGFIQIYPLPSDSIQAQMEYRALLYMYVDLSIILSRYYPLSMPPSSPLTPFLPLS